MSMRVLVDRTGDVYAGVKALSAKRVLIGYPAETALRKPEPGEKSEPLSNAAIAYIMEYGAPEANIPARPTLVPGVEAIAQKASDRFKATAKKALDGDRADFDKALGQIGLIAVASVRDKIVTGAHTPLADSTLRKRAAANNRRGFGAKVELERRRQGEIAGTEWAQPLVWSGQMVGAVNFVVVKAGQTDAVA